MGRAARAALAVVVAVVVVVARGGTTPPSDEFAVVVVVMVSAFSPPPYFNCRRRGSLSSSLSSLRNPMSITESYLDSLGVSGSSDTTDDEDMMMRALRRKRAVIRDELSKSRRRAAYDAMRRTNLGEAIGMRIWEGEERRREKERKKYERMYVEKRREILLDDAEENEEEKRSSGDDGDGGGRSRRNRRTGRRRGMPILDRRAAPFVDAPPLLVGSALTLRRSNMTPFQLRAVEVARQYHEEHLEEMEEAVARDAGEDDDGAAAGGGCGIQAAPVIAVVDGYTGLAAEEALAVEQDPEQRQRRWRDTPRTFATVASIEFVYDNDTDELDALRLMGVGRVFLRDYFSSSEAGKTREEEELSNLLARIQEFDEDDLREEDEDDYSTTSQEEEEDDGDDELVVVMAEFDIFLDDSSILPPADTKYGGEVTRHRVSSMHAVTELYRSANRVYRLHEERRGLVAGLRAGEARLRMGRDRAVAAAAYEECLVMEFEDCDGLGLASSSIDGTGRPKEGERTALPEGGGESPRSRLEALENYGLGGYGVLSSIPALTKHLMSLLEPYYSPSHREREEYEAEVASMVAFRALEGYATPEEVAAALLAPSATERLCLAHDIMARHREQLDELAELISRELRECGEECTDLW